MNISDEAFRLSAQWYREEVKILLRANKVAPREYEALLSLRKHLVSIIDDTDKKKLKESLTLHNGEGRNTKLSRRPKLALVHA